MISHIKIQDLTKNYGKTVVLDHVNMTGSYQHITSIVGINGAGKTTLFKIIAGLDTPNGGKILVDGSSNGCRGAQKALHDGVPEERHAWRNSL